MIIEAIGAPIYQIAESCSFRDRLPGLGGEKKVKHCLQQSRVYDIWLVENRIFIIYIYGGKQAVQGEGVYDFSFV